MTVSPSTIGAPVRPFGKGQPADPFHQRLAPLDVAGGGVDTQEHSVGRLQINLLGLGIVRRAANRVPVVRRVGNEVTKLLFPDQFAGGGIEARQRLDQVLKLSAVAKNIKPAVDDRRRALSRQWGRPQRLLRRQMLLILFQRDARLQRAAPLRPVQGFSRVCGGQGAEEPAGRRKETVRTHGANGG